MFCECADEGSVLCPNLESCDAGQVVVTFINCLNDGEAFKFHRAVSRLRRREGNTATLYQSEPVLVDLNQGKTNVV